MQIDVLEFASSILITLFRIELDIMLLLAKYSSVLITAIVITR